MSRVLAEVEAEMDVRAKALLERLAERDRARNWPRVPICWPPRSPRMEAADYWREGPPDVGTGCASDTTL